MKRSIKILVVDDHEENLELVKTWLETKRDDFHILTAATPEDALAIAQRELIHLAVIDVILSDDPEDRRGFDLAIKIWSGIPKVFLTVLTDVHSSRAGLRKEMRETANIVDYIPRSVGDSEQELLKVISDVINSLNLSLEIQWGNFSSIMLVEMLKGFKSDEDHKKKVIAEELESLFCQAFPNAKSISIMELKRGKGGCAVAHVAPTLEDGDGAEVMVKFGPRDAILEEFQNYKNYVKDRVPFESTAVSDAPAETPHLAAIKYSFVGGSTIMGSFKDFFKNAQPREIEELLRHLLKILSKSGMTPDTHLEKTKTCRWTSCTGVSSRSTWPTTGT
jgi:CheY-like chemotaxis protein